jgi:hypothetical protein
MSSRRANPAGFIQPPRSSNTYVSKKRLILGNMVYTMTIYDSPNGINFYIGSNKIYCIDINIFKNNDGSFVNFALLSKIRKDSECYAGGVYEEGVTSSNLFKFAIQFLFDKFPTIEKLHFNDTSNIPCDNGFQMNLATLKFLTTGKTWYEKSFHAVLVSESDKHTIQNHIQRLNKLKQDTPYEVFANKFPINSIQLPLEYIIELYNNTNTWQDFFMAIETKVGKHKFCNILSEKYYAFVDGFLGIPNFEAFKYEVNITNIHQKYELEDISGGGSRIKKVKKTRKRLRFRWVRE